MPVPVRTAFYQRAGAGAIVAVLLLTMLPVLAVAQPADSTSPVTTVTASAGPLNGPRVPYTSDTWSSAEGVYVRFDAVDEGGSGFDHFHFRSTLPGQSPVVGDVASNPTLFPISNEGTTTIEYQAVDVANNTEAVRTFVIKLDRNAPVTTATGMTDGAPGEEYLSGAWTTERVDVTFSADDGSGIGFDHFALTFVTNGGTPANTILENNGVTLRFTVEGTTIVTYQAVDELGNLEVAQTFTVNIDITAPLLVVSATLTVNATSPAGAFVTLEPAVTASDNLTPGDQIAIVCNPPSGSLFAEGVTPVSCTATDLAGNTDTKAFDVRVLGADTQLAELYGMVQNTRISGAASTANSVRRNLLAQVSLARMLEGYGQDTMACLTLTRLELEIRGQVSRRRLSNSDAQDLWEAIDAIQLALGCGGQTPS